MANHLAEAPMLPPASVDFNALHDACRAGAKAEKALEQAIIPATLAEPEGADSLLTVLVDGDALDDRTKFDKSALQERARSLGIVFESDANMARLKELLRAHPEGVPADDPPADVIADQGDGPVAATATDPA